MFRFGLDHLLKFWFDTVSDTDTTVSDTDTVSDTTTTFCLFLCADGQQNWCRDCDIQCSGHQLRQFLQRILSGRDKRYFNLYPNQWLYLFRLERWVYRYRDLRCHYDAGTERHCELQSASLHLYLNCR